jgi:hypothetical protein
VRSGGKCGGVGGNPGGEALSPVEGGLTNMLRLGRAGMN